MSKSAELHNLSKTFSGDALVTTHHRSGDTDKGKALWDLVTSVQSAEDDLIEREEQNERQRAKIIFSRILKVYFKKILSNAERQFLVACMHSNNTPYKVGQVLGVDYYSMIENINRKHNENFKRLILFASRCGFSLCGGVDFLPKLNKYFKQRKFWRLRYADIKDERNAKRRLEYQGEAGEKIRKKAIEFSHNYYLKNREKVLIYKADYYYTPQRQAYIKAYHKKNAEKIREYQRQYREKKRQERKL